MAASDGKSPQIDSRVVLRFRCWVNSTGSEHEEKKQLLEAWFKQRNLEHWKVEAVPECQSSGNYKYGNTYIPITFDLYHNTLSSYDDLHPRQVDSLWREIPRVSTSACSIYVPGDAIDSGIRLELARYWQESHPRHIRGKVPGANRVKTAPDGPSIESLYNAGRHLWQLASSSWSFLQRREEQTSDASTSTSQDTSSQPGQHTPQQTSQSGTAAGRSTEIPQQSAAPFTDKEQTSSSNEGFFKSCASEISAAVKSTTEVVTQHLDRQQALDADVNANYERFAQAYVTFQTSYNNVMAQLSYLNAQQKTSSLADLDAQLLRNLGHSIRNLIIVNSTMYNDLFCVTGSMKAQHDGYISPMTWMVSGVVVVCCAAYFCVGPALFVGGLSGAIGTIYGGVRGWNESKAEKYRAGAQATSRLIAHKLENLLAVVAVCHCESVLQYPFQKLTKPERERFLQDFGIDTFVISEEAYIKGKIDKAEEELKFANKAFVKAFDDLRKYEGLNEIYRAPV